MSQELESFLLARQAEWSRLGIMVNGAELCGEILTLLHEAQLAADAGILSLESAAAESGYSKDHLRRLARQGRIIPIRRGRRLSFRRGDLPRKPPVDPATPTSYDGVADARQVAVRRSRR